MYTENIAPHTPLASATLLAFPAMSAHTAPPPRLPAPTVVDQSRLHRTWSEFKHIRLAELANRLGIAHRPVRGQIEYIRAQTLHRSFPAPKVDRVIRGVPVGGIAAICKAALWDREAVETWLCHTAPPQEVAAMDDRAREAARTAMATRAATIAAMGRKAA